MAAPVGVTYIIYILVKFDSPDGSTYWVLNIIIF